MPTVTQVSKKFCFILLLLTAMLPFAKGDETSLYSDIAFLIFDFPHDYTSSRDEHYVSIESLLERNVGGFAFYPEFDDANNRLVHYNGNRRVYLENSLVEIKKFLIQNPDKILTLFFFVDTIPKAFYQLFDAASLTQLAYWHDSSEDWPSLETLKINKKQLIVFVDSPNSSVRGSFNSFNNHVAEYSFPTKQFVNTLDLATKYKLLLTRGYTSYLVENYPPSVNDNPLIINHYIDIWRNLGRIPNFIFLDSRVFTQFNAIKSILGVTEVISGKATLNHQMLDKVYWKPPLNSITQGEFQFPKPDNMHEISPSKPGYIFEPISINITESKDLHSLNFEAIPLDITDNLIAYYTMNGDAKDATKNNNNGTPDGVSFVNDDERGQVASFDGDDVITLPKSEHIKIRNSSFTVSVWFNVKEFAKTDHSIIGTENVVYRKGLHLILRDRVPYFGFFANDLSGKTVIKEGKWYHVVWRYNLLNGEQVIYVNGKEDGRSYNHPSFAGEEELVISKSILRDSYFIGKMDDIGIWNRPLGEYEIRNLYNGISNPLKELRKNQISKYGIYALFALPILLVLALWKRITGWSKSLLSQNAPQANTKKEIQPTRYKNAIYLFGKFEVFDNEGHEISQTFSDKVRALFLVMLSNCQMGKKGITSEELELILWPDLDKKKAANNRRVNILKLRNLLKGLDHVEIIQNRKSWVLEISDNVYCDLLEYLKVKQHKGHYKIEYFKNVLPIIKRGEFLKNTYHELEDFKMSVSYEIIDVLEIYLQNYSERLTQEEIIEIADRILIIDDLNQVAVQFKAKALIHQNNNKLARHVYESFIKRYKETYDEDFSFEFDDFILK